MDKRTVLIKHGLTIADPTEIHRRQFRVLVGLMTASAKLGSTVPCLVDGCGQPLETAGLSDVLSTQYWIGGELRGEQTEIHDECAWIRCPTCCLDYVLSDDWSGVGVFKETRELDLCAPNPRDGDLVYYFELPPAERS